jgi:hypothetical protein
LGGPPTRVDRCVDEVVAGVVEISVVVLAVTLDLENEFGEDAAPAGLDFDKREAEPVDDAARDEVKLDALEEPDEAPFENDA